MHRRAFSAAIALLAMAAFGANELLAQRFQSVFGGANCRESARYGVKQLAGGGYIAVGETFSNTPTCSSSDVYVVRISASGTLLWSNTYNIGGLDSATDVIQDSNGDFVICGVTRQVVGCNTNRDIFLLKVFPTGTAGPTATYGSPTQDDIAWNLVEATTGSGSTSPGDYIVAGATGGTGTNYNAYLLRTDQGLNMIWDRWYDAGGTNDDDLFYGVCETVLNNMSPVADIVAVGYSTSTSGAGGKDVFVVRVDGTNGTMTSTVHGAALYGNVLDDEGRAIVEIQGGTSPGNFVIAGISNSRGASSSNSEVLLLAVAPLPCTFVGVSYTGDNGAGADGAIDLKENTFSPAAAREVIVTGFTSFGNATLTGKNVFLQRYLISTLFPVGTGMAYGGNGNDEGWSVNIAANVGSNPSQTQGFVVAGYTQSPNLITSSNPEQMYLIKTNTALSSLCNQVAFTFSPLAPTTFLNWCGPGTQGTLNFSCTTFPNIGSNTWVTQLCYIAVGTQKEDNGGNDGVSGVESPSVISFSEGTVSSYPNPLAKGEILSLRFDMTSAASAEIIVSDVLGEVVHRESAALEAGSALHALKTDGWPAGSYQISIRIGETVRGTRVVLLGD